MGEGNKTEKDAKQMKKEREVLLCLIANPCLRIAGHRLLTSRKARK